MPLPRSRSLARALTAAVVPVLLAAGVGWVTPATAQVGAVVAPVRADAARARPHAAPRALPQAPAPALSGPRGFTVPTALMGMHGLRTGNEAAAVGSYRLNQSEWGRIQPARGTFVWSGLDAAIGTASNAGVRDLLLIIGLTPGWATPSGANPPGTYDPPANLDDWDTWVDAISKRYAGRGYAYQVWNEANLRTFFNGSPELMAEMTARAYRIIKANDPTARVVAASTTTRLPGSYRVFFPRYLAALRSYGWPVDAFSAHLYPPSTGTPLDVQGYIAQVKRTIREAGAPYRQLWNTEINYGLAGPGPAYPKVEVTGDRAAAWVARTYLDSLRLGVQRAYWYMQTPPDSLLGIQMWSDQPGLSAQRTLAAWIVGTRWNGCARSGSVLRCTTTQRGSTATIVWSESGNGVAVAPAFTRVRCDVRGRCTPTRPGQLVPLGELPVRFSG